jgi:5-methyltetrahydropteroyltriglutamate--homocysteine methyltransferase
LVLGALREKTVPCSKPPPPAACRNPPGSQNLKIVGGLAPEWRRARARQGKSSRFWIEAQERAGIDIVTDGEQFRIHFVHASRDHPRYRLDKKTSMGIRNNRYTVDVPTVTGPLRRSRSVHASEVRYTRAVAHNNSRSPCRGP